MHRFWRRSFRTLALLPAPVVAAGWAHSHVRTFTVRDQRFTAVWPDGRREPIAGSAVRALAVRHGGLDSDPPRVALDERRASVVSADGRLWVQFLVVRYPIARPWALDVFLAEHPEFDNDPGARVFPADFLPVPPARSSRKLQFAHRPIAVMARSGDERVLDVPYTLVFAVAAVPALLVLARSSIRRARAASRRRRGRCTACGYLLTATKDRCPECGTAVPPPPHA